MNDRFLKIAIAINIVCIVLAFLAGMYVGTHGLSLW